jgi:hypothetical protein
MVKTSQKMDNTRIQNKIFHYTHTKRKILTIDAEVVIRKMCEPFSDNNDYDDDDDEYVDDEDEESYFYLNNRIDCLKLSVNNLFIT